MVFDYILICRREWSLLWGQRWTLITLLLLLNRGVVLLSAIGAVVPYTNLVSSQWFMIHHDIHRCLTEALDVSTCDLAPLEEQNLDMFSVDAELRTVRKA